MKDKYSGIIRGVAVSLAVFAVVLAVGFSFIGGINDRYSAGQAELVRNAVHQAALTCYAVEGAYPPSLTYLKQHYSLAYDETAYGVYYSAFASNIFPEIIVTEKGVGQ